MNAKTKAADKAGTEEKGPDNNKRLATLEGSTAGLIARLATLGVVVAEGEDPFPQLEARKTDLETIEAQAAKIAELDAADGQATPGELAAIKRADDADARSTTLANEKLAIENDLEQRRADVSKLAEAILDAGFSPEGDEGVVDCAIRLIAGKAAEAEGDAVVAAADREARECGIAAGQSAPSDIAGLIDEGQKFELVFVADGREILELAPIAIEPNDLEKLPSGYGIRPEIEVRGDRAGVPLKLEGAALLCHGEQVSFCAFEPALPLNPGDQRRFARQFIFGRRY
jgi:hypothetical protein